MWRSVMLSDESRLHPWRLDHWGKVWRRCREQFGDHSWDDLHLLVEAVWWFRAASLSMAKKGFSSLEAKSVERDLEMKLCNQWKYPISRVWDQTLSSMMTTFTPTVGCLCKSDQNNHTETNAGPRTGSRPTAEWDQAGDQYEEMVPGW